jgi:hypothetical protein
MPTWSTEADWDAAQSDTDTQHPGSVLGLYSYDGFEDGAIDGTYTGTGNSSTTTSRSYDGQYSLRQFGTGLTCPSVVETSPDEIRFYHQETTNQTGFILQINNESGNQILQIGTNNPQPVIRSGDGDQQYSLNTYQKWNEHRLEFDWANSQVSYYWRFTDDSDSWSVTNQSFINPSSGIGSWEITDSSLIGGSSTAQNMWLDNVWGVEKQYDSPGNLTTGVKQL